jgi:hypothetical protein
MAAASVGSGKGAARVALVVSSAGSAAFGGERIRLVDGASRASAAAGLSQVAASLAGKRSAGAAEGGEAWRAVTPLPSDAEPAFAAVALYATALGKCIHVGYVRCH